MIIAFLGVNLSPFSDSQKMETAKNLGETSFSKNEVFL